jgi:hypothetical protein
MVTSVTGGATYAPPAMNTERDTPLRGGRRLVLTG